MASHPGQNPGISPPKTSMISMRTVKGNVRRISNKPRASNLRKAFRFKVELLASVTSKPWLRLKYVMINLAARNECQVVNAS